MFGQDCFHFSSKGHAAAAVALWNNMVRHLFETGEMSLGKSRSRFDAFGVITLVLLGTSWLSACNSYSAKRL